MTKVFHGLRDLSRLLRRDQCSGIADGDLLKRFVDCQDEVAFEAILVRHGSMVLSVCRRVLRNEADAEDAYQATFLVFIRKAASVRPQNMVGNWLYGVAHTTALKARKMRALRLTNERKGANYLPKHEGSSAHEDLREVVNRELEALPEKYRSALVLCDLEGQTIIEAARHLGCPPGTMSTRVSRARRLLARRLGRHGLPVCGLAITTMFLSDVSASQVSPSLRAATMNAALMLAKGTSIVEAVSAQVLGLQNEVLRAMLLTKIKTSVLVLLAVALIGIPISAWATSTSPPVPIETLPRENEVAKNVQKEDDVLKKMQGTWALDRVLYGGDQESSRRFRDPSGAVRPAFWKITADSIIMEDLFFYPHSDKIRAKIKLGIKGDDEKAMHPQAIDLFLSPGGLHWKGIYKFNGDELHLCLRHRGLGGRPTTFETDKAVETHILVLNRVKQ